MLVKIVFQKFMPSGSTVNFPGLNILETPNPGEAEHLAPALLLQVSLQGLEVPAEARLGTQLLI